MQKQYSLTFWLLLIGFIGFTAAVWQNSKGRVTGEYANTDPKGLDFNKVTSPDNLIACKYHEPIPNLQQAYNNGRLIHEIRKNNADCLPEYVTKAPLTAAPTKSRRA